MEEIFSFLFKYRPFFFLEGEFGFQLQPQLWQVAAVFVLMATGLGFIYSKQLSRYGSGGWFLLGLRAAVFVFLALLLMRPTLTLPTLVPQKSVLAILADNSKSMGIRDSEGIRGEFLRDLLSEDSGFLDSLGSRFRLQQFKFDTTAAALNDPEELNWTGDQTNISAGLERVLSETQNLPLGGVIVFSDGSDNSHRDSDSVLGRMQASGIPVHTVGLGPTEPATDIEIIDVSTPRRILPDSVAVARVSLRHSGFGGSRGRLEIREGTTLVESQEVYFPRDNDLVTAEVKLFPEGVGTKDYSFQLLPLQGEALEENNRRRALIQVEDSSPRVLYVEGRPRWEYKFLRQALGSDRHLVLESLLRTALNKYYRQGIEDESTLASGFPAKKEDLYSYQGLVLGDVEAGFFTYDQMEMIRDFVGDRGGGLLMLGGALTLAAGGYQNTPIEEALPVWINDGASSNELIGLDSHRRSDARIILTAYGSNHAALLLAQTPAESQQQWDSLPSLTDQNLVGSLKPGSTVLAQFVPAGSPSDRGQPLLVSQRFGRGLGLVFLTASSWRWQMLQDHLDQSHETFWRQILRWLVSSAPPALSIETERLVYSKNEPVRLRAEVNDSSFNRINNSRVEAKIVSSTGDVSDLQLDWKGDEDGIYSAVWFPQEDGIHQIQVTAAVSQDGEEAVLENASSYFVTETGNEEFFNASQKRDFLQRLSTETGGRYYSASDVGDLPEEIIYTKRDSSVTEVFGLWDMPVNFLLILALLSSEWALRRRWGEV
jgi:uncharacterized membrane protein